MIEDTIDKSRSLEDFSPVRGSVSKNSASVDRTTRARRKEGSILNDAGVRGTGADEDRTLEITTTASELNHILYFP
jgi:hypothetical protein